MAIVVTGVTEDFDGRSATLSEDGTRTAQRRFQVALNLAAATTEDRAAVEIVVETALPVSLYDPHDAYPEAIARTVTLAPNGSHGQWAATVGYSSAPFPAIGDGSGAAASGGGGGPSSPSGSGNNSTEADQRPPEISVKRKEVSEVLAKDVVTGKKVVNKAGDPFDPPVEVTRGRLVYDISFFCAPDALDWDTRSEFWDTVNDADFTMLDKTHASKTLRVVDLSHQGMWDKGPAGLAFFWRVNVQLEYKPDGWTLQVRNVGYRELYTGDGDEKLRHITDKATGQPVNDPVPLDAAGHALPAGFDLDDWDPLPFDGYLPVDFTDLLAR